MQQALRIFRGPCTKCPEPVYADEPHWGTASVDIVDGMVVSSKPTYHHMYCTEDKS